MASKKKSAASSGLSEPNKVTGAGHLKSRAPSRGFISASGANKARPGAHGTVSIGRSRKPKGRRSPGDGYPTGDVMLAVVESRLEDIRLALRAASKKAESIEIRAKALAELRKLYDHCRDSNPSARTRASLLAAIQSAVRTHRESLLHHIASRVRECIATDEEMAILAAARPSQAEQAKRHAAMLPAAMNWTVARAQHAAYPAVESIRTLFAMLAPDRAAALDDVPDTEIEQVFRIWRDARPGQRVELNKYDAFQALAERVGVPSVGRKTVENADANAGRIGARFGVEIPAAKRAKTAGH